jgi:hypothetical protein
LNVSVRCGCKANARQMRCTVLRLKRKSSRFPGSDRHQAPSPGG